MKVGRIQTLVVSRISDYGLYLKDDEESEVLLPNRFVSLDMKVGDSIEVFVYHDSEDRLVASTERPKITEGCVAWLEVVDKSFHGAFLDWGLSSKHLFLPNRNQQGRHHRRPQDTRVHVCRPAQRPLRGYQQVQGFRL